MDCFAPVATGTETELSANVTNLTDIDPPVTPSWVALSELGLHTARLAISGSGHYQNGPMSKHNVNVGNSI